MRRLTVAILGNHRTSYCTECELDWTFENMGHKVLRFQEDTGPTQVIAAQCESEKVDLFIYVHTHGWQTPGRLSFQEMIQRIKSAGAITCGFHLDLYWGLNASDRRTDRIGQHPFWKMDHVFTADGGHDDGFRARGVNHHWLPPAVVARDCRRGDFRPELAADVAFVGSRHYHPEYPFRTRLVDWLQRQYGPRFKHFGPHSPNGAFREQRLNDLYASVKVAVGDSCFAGIPKYWSDRVPETLGRGGFLIHPKVEGLNIPGLATYEPGNLDDLKQKIDYYLENESERRVMADQAFNWVLENETYTDRVGTMLNIMGLNQ